MGGKSGSSTTTGQIPPELRPLATATTSNILNYARNNPLDAFSGRNPQQIASLSPEERGGLGQVPGLFGASPLEALAFQSILRAPGYAGAGPTTGTPDFSGGPSLEDLYGYLGGNGADAVPIEDPNDPYSGFGPNPGVPGPPGNPSPPGQGNPNPNAPEPVDPRGGPRQTGATPAPPPAAPGPVAPRGPHAAMTASGAQAAPQGATGGRGGNVGVVAGGPSTATDWQYGGATPLQGSLQPGAPLAGGYHWGSDGQIYDQSGRRYNQQTGAVEGGSGNPQMSVQGSSVAPAAGSAGDPGRMPVVPPGGQRPPTVVVPPRTGGGDGSNPAPDFGALEGAQPRLVGGMSIGSSPGVTAAYRQATGQDIINDPAVQQTIRNFTSTIQPGILNQSTLMGLGRSDSANRAVSTAQGQMLAPLYLDAISREENRNARGAAAVEEELGRRERSSNRIADAYTNQASMLAGLAGQRYGEQTGAIGTAMQAGATRRGVNQMGADAAFQDFLRRQGLSEQASFGPWSALAQGSLGTHTVSSGK